MIRKRLLSACLALALCLSLLPATALAAESNTVYVGGVALTRSSDSTVYATTNENGEVITESATANNYNIMWDGSTLTLDGAKIKGAYSSESLGATVGIYASSNSGGVSLNIALKGVNEIFESSYGIWVYSNADDVTLTIEGEGSLNASGSSSGILVQSNSGDAALTIQNADVTAENSIYSGDGVTVRAGSSSSASLSVDGGSLTATGKSELGAGIRYTFGGGSSGSGVPSLNVSNSAIVKASGGKGGISDNSSTDIKIGVGDNSSGGIVFDGNKGTVYGSVELQENLTIGEGERLDIPSGASLTIDSGATLTVNGGELTGNIPTNGVVYKVTGVTLSETTLTLEVGDTATLTATVEPDEASNKNVTWSSSPDNIVTIAPDTTGSKKATVTATGTGTTTITATVDGQSAECSVTVNAAATVPVTSVSLNKTSLELTEGETAQLNATVLPETATNRNVTWSSNAPGVATVDSSGKVTAVAPGTATITVTTADGGKTATCVVTVTAATVPVTGVTLSQTQASLYCNRTPDTLALTARVAPDNATNKAMTWTSSDSAVATVDQNGIVTAVARGTAVITVTTEDGAKTATCTVTVSRYSSGGGPTTYAVTAPNAENGAVRVSPSRASRGTTVTITVTPDEGYELESLTVLDSRDNEITLTDKGDGKYTFTMPSGKVTVEASFAEIAPEPLPFGDVDDGDWFADAVRFVYENGMMNGVSETDFAPHAATSRSMIVTILYRLEGEPVVDYAMDFTDVAGDAYYAEAVRWAASEGIVGGYGGGLFGSDDAVTREQLAAILYRYAVYKGYDVSIGEDTNILSYADFADLSEYAIPAIQWACGAGIVNGTSESTLTPQGEATRAQVAAMLMRFVEAIG